MMALFSFLPHLSEWNSVYAHTHSIGYMLCSSASSTAWVLRALRMICKMVPSTAFVC